MDQIKIENLEVFAHHGVFPEESTLGQKFLISAALYTDMRQAGLSDRICDTVNYAEICRFISDYMRNHKFKLIERAAEGLAQELLVRVKRLEGIEIEIKKPWAPVGIPLKYVSVKISREWHTAYIALGSNAGDRKKYIEDAVFALKSTRGCRVIKMSALYETKPYGFLEQEDFLNGCLKLRTLLAPEELLAALHKIEAAAGRKRDIRWGPRTLDLDIVFYDSLVLGTDDLCIPHIDMQRRDFVLTPLCEIAPYARHPVTKKTAREMLDELRAVK